MISINNVNFGYTDTDMVIKDLSLKISKNEKVSIIGKSGCGKTTLLYLLGSILKPLNGQILIEQQPLTTYRKETSLIFQNGGLFPWKTVYQNLELGLKVRGLKQYERRQKIESILSELNISAYKNRFIKELSGGQRQRVAIARSLVLESDLLLLDEPSSALDAMTKDRFQKTMLDLYRNHEITSIVVTHDIFEAVYLGQKIIIMDDGNIKHIVANELYGTQNAKESIQFYQKCIEIKEML